MGSLTRTLLLALLLPIRAGLAAEPPTPVETPDMDAVVEARNADVLAAQTAGYAAGLAQLQGMVSQFPDVTGVLVGQCRFIQGYAWSEEAPIERAAEDHEQCLEALRDPRYADDATAQLFLLGQLYGEEAVTAGEELLSRAGGWSAQDRAKVYETLYYATQFEDAERGMRYAVRAVEEDPDSKLRLEVAKHWLQQGAFQRMQRLIGDTPPGAWEGFGAQEGASLLIAVGAPEDAAALLLDNVPEEPSVAFRATRARALAASGHITDARGIYASLLEGQQALPQPYLEQYTRFQLAHGTAEEAAAAYGKLRDVGYSADPLARYRLELTVRHPLAPWHWRDIPGVLVLLLVFAIVALAPGVLIAGVHYRSLVKRLRGEAPREGRWGLRQAWIALAAMFIAQLLAMYIFYYDQLAALLSDSTLDQGSIDVHALAWTALVDSLLALVLLLPLLRGINLRALLLGHTRLLPTIGLALLAYMGVRIAGAAYGAAMGIGETAGALGDMTTLSIQSTHAVFGAAIGLLLLAVVVPLVEEFVFRGVVLQGLSRYIPFGWVALIQAVLFALVHESVAVMPIIFLIGYLAAWLVKRTGGLLAPILLHGVNNAAAYAGITLVTSVLNRA